MLTSQPIDILSLRELYRAYTENNSPLERYPGVTRVLSQTKDMTGLDAWRERVGDEEADRIIKESQEIGTNLDTRVNDYFNGATTEIDSEYNKQGMRLFGQLSPILKNVSPIVVQGKVWSDNLRCMGYFDCLGVYENELTLIDVKNSKYAKKPEYLEDYWYQATAYTLCLYDMLGIKVKKVALFVALRYEPLPQIIMKETKPFIPGTIGRINKYYKEKE